MISKISKIKNFGIYENFLWQNDLAEFKKFNLIYGWNRSGKTTVSRIFSSIEKKNIGFKQYPENGEFEIKMNDNTNIKNSDIETNNLPIKVFNQDFIDDNISFISGSSCNPIVYISEEDIKSKEKLQKLKNEKVSLEKSFEEIKKEKRKNEEIKNNFLTGLGREIANSLFEKSYNKIKVENKINEVGINNFIDKKLSDNDKKKFEDISKSEAKKEQFTLLKHERFNFQSTFDRVQNLLKRQVLSELLERLKDPEDIDGGLDEDLNSWVKQGFDLHKSHNQFEKCFFCNNEIKGDLFNSLSKHFSKDYQDLQDSIKYIIKDLQNEKIEKIIERNFELYSDLLSKYEQKTKEYNIIIEKHNKWLWDAEMWLEQKHRNPFNPDIQEMLDSPEDYRDLLNEKVDELNSIISEHNTRRNNHVEEVKKSKEKLELHFISVAISEQDYKKYCSEIEKSIENEKIAKDLSDNNSKIIIELEKQNSNIGEAITKINKHLKEFFGKEEIKLELDENKKGYLIKRQEKIAKNLSEGEKTAIAFCYFIVKVEEKDFKIKDGIIFIDDPISSFDSNFIYHAFSLIQNHFKETKQLFISTHNFQFFNLVKDWFITNNKTRISNGKEEQCEFYMIETYNENDLRKSKIVPLDKTLKNYKSEYHFLFFKLNEFTQKQNIEYEDFYTISNIARRFFDIFADFKIPDSRDQKQKLEAIIKTINKEIEIINSVDINKAYKLVNDFSHNSAPTSTIEHKEKSESKDAIKILLSIVEKSDPKHYEILEKNI